MSKIPDTVVTGISTSPDYAGLINVTLPNGSICDVDATENACDVNGVYSIKPMQQLYKIHEQAGYYSGTTDVLYGVSQGTSPVSCFQDNTCIDVIFYN